MAVTLAQAWFDYVDGWVRPQGQEVRRVMYVWKNIVGFFDPNFKAKWFEDVRHSREYRDHRVKQGVKPATVRRELTLLEAALNRGVKEGLIKSRPNIDKPPNGQPRERYLSVAEVQRLWVEVEKIKATKPRIHLAMWLCLCTWARAGAIEDRKVKHVDLFTMRTIDFRTAGARVTKKRRAVVPISDELWPVLYEYIYRNGPPWGEDSLLPPGPRGKLSTTYHGCKAVEKAAGIDEAYVCRHVFRKTGPSHAAQAGESLDFIAEALGDTAQTTKRHYAHLQPENVRKTINRTRFLPAPPGVKQRHPRRDGP